MGLTTAQIVTTAVWHALCWLRAWDKFNACSWRRFVFNGMCVELAMVLLFGCLFVGRNKAHKTRLSGLVMCCTCLVGTLLLLVASYCSMIAVPGTYQTTRWTRH